MADDHTRAQDEEHLRLLAIFHFILAGLAALFSLIQIGILLAVASQFGQSRSSSFTVVGGRPHFSSGVSSRSDLESLVVSMGWLILIVVLLMCFLLVRAGILMLRKNNRIHCIVVDAILCLFFPLGTVLGVLSLIKLTQPSVRDLFDQAGHAPPDRFAVDRSP